MRVQVPGVLPKSATSPLADAIRVGSRVLAPPQQPSSSDYSPPSDAQLSLSGPAFVDLLVAVFDKGVPFRFRAGGSSMMPFIRDGDVITVAPLGDVPPRTGDVIAFTWPHEQRLVIHRAVGKRDDAFLTQGDNASGPDGFIPAESVLGRVIRVERAGKTVRLGLGPERLLIAFLTRRRLLRPLLLPLWRLMRPLSRRGGNE